MTDMSNERPQDAPLNPALKSTTDTVHDVRSTPAPLDTTNAHEGQGEGWPLVWFVVTIVGVALAVYFLV